MTSRCLAALFSALACGPTASPPDRCECVLVPPADARWIRPAIPADSLAACAEREPENGCEHLCALREAVEEYRSRYPDTFARFVRECAESGWLFGLPPELRLHDRTAPEERWALR